MARKHLLAAAIFSYSYSNYEDHLGINERFDRLKPHDAQILERALKEQWSLEKVAQNLEVSADVANELLEATQWALEIVDAKNHSGLRYDNAFNMPWKRVLMVQILLRS